VALARRLIEPALRRAYQGAGRIARERREAPPRLRVGDAKGSGTIFYLTPDFDEPSGGVRTMYRHVDVLNQTGRRASVLHGRPRFRCTWFENETTVADASSTILGRSDLLVIPEVFSALLPTLPAGTSHVVFNQGCHLTWRRAPELVSRHHRESIDLRGVMTVSAHSAELLRYAFPRLAVHRVRHAIDPGTFSTGTSDRTRRVCYLPRRGSEDATVVIEMLRSRGALEGWQVVALDGLAPSELARELRESTIFLSFAYQEGFGLPPAEAMACGCYVVGFDGFGGREFFRPELSRPVPVGDVLAMAQALEEVLAQESRQPGWCAARGLAASRFVLDEYSAVHEQGDIGRFYDAVLSC
jgi:hypothetical protein